MTRMTLQTAKKLEAGRAFLPMCSTCNRWCLWTRLRSSHAAAETGRVIIVEESRDRCSAASHIAAVLVDKGFSTLKAPVRRITVPDTAMPYAPSAELPLLPNAAQVMEAAKDLMEEGS